MKVPVAKRRNTFLRWLAALLSSFVFAFGPNNASATSIVAYRTPKRILIAADGLAKFAGGAQSEICKIIRVGSVYIAISGLEHDERPGRDYFPSRIVQGSYSPSKSFEQLIDDVDKRMIEAGLVEIQNIKAFDIAMYAGAHKDGSDSFTQVLMAQIKNGRPYLAELDFVFTDDGTIKIFSHRTVCPRDCQSLPLRLGRRAHVDSYLALHPFENYDSPQTLKHLVESEVDSRDVGPPIAVLELDKGGEHWVEQGNGCPASVPRSNK